MRYKATETVSKPPLVYVRISDGEVVLLCPFLFHFHPLDNGDRF